MFGSKVYVHLPIDALQYFSGCFLHISLSLSLYAAVMFFT